MRFWLLALLLEAAIAVELREDGCRPKSTNGASAEAGCFWSSAVSKSGKPPVGQSRHFALQRRRQHHRSELLPSAVPSRWPSFCVRHNRSGFLFVSRILDPSCVSGNPPEGIIALDSMRFRCRTKSTSGPSYMAAPGDVDGRLTRRELTGLLLERLVR